MIYICGYTGTQNIQYELKDDNIMRVFGDIQLERTSYIGPRFYYNFEEGDEIVLTFPKIQGISLPSNITIYNVGISSWINVMKDTETDILTYRAVIKKQNILSKNTDNLFIISIPLQTDISHFEFQIEIKIYKKDNYNKFHSLDDELNYIQNNSKNLDKELNKKIQGLTFWSSSSTIYKDKILYQHSTVRDNINQVIFDQGNCAICKVNEQKEALISGYGWDKNYNYFLYAITDISGSILQIYHDKDVHINETITLPDNAYYLYVNGNSSTKAEIKIYTQSTDFIENYNEVVNNTYNKTYYKGIFMGDSITALTGERSWPEQFAKIIPLESLINVAVAGATLVDKNNTVYDGNPVFQGDDNGENNVLGNQVQKIINNNYDAPDFIMIAIGTNAGINTTFEDAYSVYYNNDKTIKPLEEVDRKTAAGAFRYCNEKLHELYPEAMIIWCTPIQAVETTRNIKDIITWGDNLKLLCSIGSNYCIDTEKCGILGRNEISNTNGEDLIDGLHPNSHGAKKMGYYNACEFKKFLDKIDQKLKEN